MGKSLLKLSFEEVDCRFYGHKLRFSGSADMSPVNEISDHKTNDSSHQMTMLGTVLP